jgi:hypothetical protein
MLDQGRRRGDTVQGTYPAQLDHHAGHGDDLATGPPTAASMPRHPPVIRRPCPPADPPGPCSPGLFVEDDQAAQVLAGLAGRGYIRPGYAADLVVFAAGDVW